MLSWLGHPFMLLEIHISVEGEGMAQIIVGHHHWWSNHTPQPAKAYHCSSSKFNTSHLGEEQRKIGGISNIERKSQVFEMQRYESPSKGQIIQ